MKLRTNDKFQVLTPRGFEDFSAVQKFERKGNVRLTHSHGVLSCSPGHKIQTPRGWYQAMDLREGDMIETSRGLSEVLIIKHDPDAVVEYYDLLDVGALQEYYTSDVLSHNCQFLGSADTLIDPNKLAILVKTQPLRQNNSIMVFEEPKPGCLYAIAADVSRGGGGDYSAFVVVNVSKFPYTVAATYRNNNVNPLVYPNYIQYAAKMYNDAMVLVETNDIGKQIADILHYELECDNILMTNRSGSKGQVLGGGFGAGAQMGVRTTTAVKRIGCSALKALVENDKILVNDYQIISELSTFVMHGSSYSAQYGKHDDLVMCLVLFSWMTTQPYFKEISDSDLRARIIADQEHMIEQDLLPFGLVDDGHDLHEDQSVIDVPFDAFDDAMR